MTNCRVYRGAELGNTDHRLLIATLCIHLKSETQRPRITKFDVAKLKDPTIAESFSVEVTNRFTALSNNQQDDWETFKDSLLASAASTLKCERLPRRPWISPETMLLIEKRREARLNGHMLEYRRLNQVRNASLKTDKERYWAEKADTLELAAKRHDHAAVFKTLKELRDEPQKKVTQMKDSQGCILTNKTDCLNRWKEHFSELLNRQPLTIEPALEQAADHTPNSSHSVDRVTSAEVSAQLKKMDNRRAPGICKITAEMLKVRSNAITQWITNILNSAWDHERCPTIGARV